MWTSAAKGVLVLTAQVFAGVPNRPSPKNGWLSPLLRVIDSCFYGLKGPWMGKIQDRLAIEHDDVAKGFKPLASRFRIITYYEADELVATNKAVSTPSEHRVLSHYSQPRRCQSIVPHSV